MALATLFIPYSFYFGLYDIYYKTDTKLDDLECSEAQKLLIKWILKNILIIAYFFPGLPLRWFINETTLLKYGSAGIALTTVWIPCVKNSPTLTILLMILHVICFVIGPFNTFRNFLRGGYRQYRGSTLVQYINMFNLFGKAIVFHFFKFSFTKPKPEDPYLMQKFLSASFVLAPLTEIDFVRVESVISVILFAISSVLY